MSGCGLVALGDSITRGRGGSPLLRVHPQSWALWLAEALELPYTNLAADAAVAADVVRTQLPRLGDGYDLACVYVGVNDARALDFDAAAFERDVGTILAVVAARAERVLVLTIPLDLGRPRAGADVVTANAILRRAAAAHGAIVCDLERFGRRLHVLPDAVHPTAPGQVAIAALAAADLAAAGVRVRHDPNVLAEMEGSAAARARYAAWWGRRWVADVRRRLVERVRALIRR